MVWELCVFFLSSRRKVKKAIQLHQVALDHFMNVDEWCYSSANLNRKKWLDWCKESNDGESNQMLSCVSMNAMITISNWLIKWKKFRRVVTRHSSHSPFCWSLVHTFDHAFNFLCHYHEQINKWIQTKLNKPFEFTVVKIFNVASEHISCYQWKLKNCI